MEYIDGSEIISTKPTIKDESTSKVQMYIHSSLLYKYFLVIFTVSFVYNHKSTF